MIVLGKMILARAVEKQKRRKGTTTHFSEIINFQFGEKCHTFSCILKPFRIIAAFLQYISEKCMVTPDSNSPFYDLLFQHSHKLHKNIPVLGSNVLKWPLACHVCYKVVVCYPNPILSATVASIELLQTELLFLKFQNVCQFKGCSITVCTEIASHVPSLVLSLKFCTEYTNHLIYCHNKQGCSMGCY